MTSGTWHSDGLHEDLLSRTYEVIGTRDFGRPAVGVTVEFVLDGQGSLAIDRAATKLAAQTNDSGGTVLHWYRWPLDLHGEIEATLRVMCEEDGIQWTIGFLAERLKPSLP